MSAQIEPAGVRRQPLTRSRVLAAALALADAGGLESLSMRKLARSLDVEPMSVYYHVANKADILDGLVDRVFSEIELPAQVPQPIDRVNGRALSKPPPLPKVCAWLTSTRTTSSSSASRRACAGSAVWMPTE